MKNTSIKFDRSLRNADIATRDLGKVARKLREAPEPCPPDIQMGSLRDFVRLAAAYGEEIVYETARGWLLAGKLRSLYVSQGGHYILDFSHARRFLEERKRRRETDAAVAEEEDRIAWPVPQTESQLAAAINLHPTWIQSAVSF